jgi:putative serine protease PepD
VAAASVRPRQWLGVAVVAALIGGVIGGAVGWATRGTTHSANTYTFKEGSSTPGAAILTGAVSIPALVKAVSPSVVSINVKTSLTEDQGTGMIVTRNGLVITNNHVISAAIGGGGTITVTRTGTTSVQTATLLGTNTVDDVALLQINGASNLPSVTFGNSGKLVVGDAVVAIGNALGLAAGTPTVTQGIVSALGRTVTAGNSLNGQSETLFSMIQTDAAINPGNSGGPLIDSSGQVIGMNTAVAGATSEGTNAQNIGFAIPAARIERLIPSLLKGGNLPHRTGAYMGVYIQSVTASILALHHLSVTSGAYVAQVISGLPAAAAGVKAGDVIVSIDGTPVTSNQSVSTIMQTIKAGKTISVGIVRGTQHLLIAIRTVAPPA